MKKIYRLPIENWYLERIIFLIAGIFTVSGVALGVLISEWFFLLSAIVGFMEIFFSLTGYCPMAIFLNKAFKINKISDLKKKQ